MGKDSTTSQLDFFLLEEVSDRAAETISGGAEVTTGLEVTVSTDDIVKPLTIPLEIKAAIDELFDELVLGMVEPADLFDMIGDIGGVLAGNG